MASTARSRTIQRSKPSQYRYAVNGSAARQPEPVPHREQRRKKQELPKQQVPKQKRVQQVKVKSRLQNPLSVFLFGVAIVATIYICVQYVQLQTEITVRLETINGYEVELNNLIAQNNELEASINNYMDLQYIYQVATEELGMTYPRQGQISEYENTSAEYVRQYGEIPEVPKSVVPIK